MKAMIRNPSKVEEVAQLKAARGCQQNPSRSGRAKDEIQTQLIRLFFWVGGDYVPRKKSSL
jgi:hypothetical protein